MRVLEEYLKKSDELNLDGHLKTLQEYVATATGLQWRVMNESQIEIFQLADQKKICVDTEGVSEILTRTDTDGQPFVQVNFKTGKKILLTSALVGFKPAPVLGLDLSKLPKVVTTPDLISVFEAIEEAMAVQASGEELDTLKKVFNSIISGGELVGFDLAQERQWLWCLLNAKGAA